MRLIVIESFWPGLLALGALSEQNESEGPQNDALVIVVGCSPHMLALRSALNQLPSVLQAENVPPIARPLFWPLSFRGAGIKLINPIRERKRRILFLQNEVIRRLGDTPGDLITEVWTSAGEWKLYLTSLFPSARFTYIDHAISDLSQRQVRNQSSWSIRLHLALEVLERFALCIPATRYSHRDLSLSPDDNTSHFKVNNDAISQFLKQYGLEVLTKYLDTKAARSTNPVIVLAPVFSSHFADKHVKAFVSMLVTYMSQAGLEPGHIIVKWHPEAVVMSDQLAETLLLNSLQSLQGETSSSVTVMRADLPIELCFALEPILLIGTFSNAFLSARLWSRNTKVAVLQWEEPYREMCARRPQSDELDKLNHQIKNRASTYSRGELNSRSFQQMINLMWQSEKKEWNRFDDLKLINSEWTWDKVEALEKPEASA